MYKVNTDVEPFWLDVAPGARVLFKPLGDQGFTAASQAMVLGLSASGDLDIGRAVGNVAFTQSAAIWGAIDWQGFGDTADPPQPLVFSKKVFEQMMEQNRAIRIEIDRLYVVPALEAYAEAQAEGNGSSPSPNGTSPAGALPGAAKATARPARGGVKRNASTPSKPRKPKPAKRSGG